LLLSIEFGIVIARKTWAREKNNGGSN